MVRGCRKNENVSSSRNRRKRSGTESFVRTCLGDCQKNKILDVGCETGFISLLLAQIGSDAIVIDNNVAMIKKAEKIFEELEFSNKNKAP